MDLPNIFGAKKSHPQQHFLALDIGEEVITAGLWSVEGNKSKFIKSSSAIEWKDENLVDAAEAADVALEELGKEADNIEQVILGLQESWLEQHNIKDERKALLKSLKEQLSLKPLGFVVSTEALVQYLKDLEGGPMNCVLAQFTTANIHVSVVKASKIEKTEIVGRSGDSVADLTEAFARMKAKALPARVILYSTRLKNEELENEKQVLLTHDWANSGYFHHLPNVETLPQNVVISAVCIAGGLEVATSLGLIQREKTNNLQENVAVGKVQEDVPSASDESKEQTENVTQPALETKSAPKLTPIIDQKQDDDTFGFADVSKVLPLSSSAEIPEKAPVEQEETLELPVPEPTLQPESQYAQPLTQQATQQFAQPKPNPLQSMKVAFQKVWNTVFAGRSLKAKFNTDVSGSRKIRFILLGVLAFLFAGSIFGYFFLQSQMKAEVTITVKTVPLAKDVQLTIDPDIAQTDVANNILKVQAVDREVSGEKERDTTGTAIVGDKAKGKVTIYNATSSEKTFPAGTVLTGPNKLKFTLSEQVVVASSSGSASSIQSGKATVSVTASGIGKDSNLAAKTELSVANFDKISYVAINDEAFTGGSSREIQAVSKDDLKKLEDELKAELQEKAKAELEAQKEGNNQVLPVTTVEVKTSDADAKVGDEVKTVKMTMTVVASAYTYSANDLLPIAQEQLKESLTQGEILREEKTTITVRDLIEPKEEGEKPSITATLNSEAIPMIDKNALVQLIQSKTIDQAKSLLREKGEIGQTEIQVKPSLAKILFNRMPKQAANIVIQTKVP